MSILIYLCIFYYHFLFLCIFYTISLLVYINSSSRNPLSFFALILFLFYSLFVFFILAFLWIWVYTVNMKRETIEQSKKAILSHIAELKLQQGDTLPPIRQLQAVLFISKNAALEARHEMCDDGFLEKGSGTRNGFLIRSVPESSSVAPKDKKLIARFMLPYNSWNYVGNQFLLHVEKEFSLRGGSLFLNNTENSSIIEHQLLQGLLSADAAKPDVLLLMASNSISNPNVELLRIIQHDIPVVLVDRTVNGFPCFSISLNHRFVGADAVSRLWSKGHRTFAFVSGFSVISPIQHRLSGYLDALQTRNCPSENQFVFLEPGMDMGSYHRIRSQISLLGDHLLQLSPQPTGIVCGSDRIATCLVNHFLSKGVSVPEDIAIIGCDGDTDFSDFCEKPLCSYRQPFRPMSEFIYQTAASILSSPSSNYYHTEFLPEFIPGSTI